MSGMKSFRGLSNEQFAAKVQENRCARMDRIDALSPELRALVHAYGSTVVTTCLQVGVSKPKHIRHLVETILDEFSPTRGSYSRQGKRTNVAQGIEARQGGDGEAGSVHESPVA